jgi:hypothetical protein
METTYRTTMAEKDLKMLHTLPATRYLIHSLIRLQENKTDEREKRLFPKFRKMAF